MDITEIKTTIGGLVTKAQDPANRAAFASTASALKDLYEMYDELSKGKTDKAQAQLTMYQDVNETLLAQSDLDVEADKHGPDWNKIADGAVTLVGTGVRIAMIVAPLL